MGNDSSCTGGMGSSNVGCIGHTITVQIITAIHAVVRHQRRIGYILKIFLSFRVHLHMLNLILFECIACTDDPSHRSYVPYDNDCMLLMFSYVSIISKENSWLVYQLVLIKVLMRFKALVYNLLTYRLGFIINVASID